MHLAFENRDLRDICLSESAAAQAFGAETSQFLRAYLADMIAAETLAELVTGNLRPDPSDPAAYLADVGQRAKLRFRANHPRARSATRPADVNYISRIIVISLEVNDARSG